MRGVGGWEGLGVRGGAAGEMTVGRAAAGGTEGGAAVVAGTGVKVGREGRGAMGEEKAVREAWEGEMVARVGGEVTGEGEVAGRGEGKVDRVGAAGMDVVV